MAIIRIILSQNLHKERNGSGNNHKLAKSIVQAIGHIAVRIGSNNIYSSILC